MGNKHIFFIWSLEIWTCKLGCTSSVVALRWVRLEVECTLRVRSLRVKCEDSIFSRGLGCGRRDKQSLSRDRQLVILNTVWMPLVALSSFLGSTASSGHVEVCGAVFGLDSTRRVARAEIKGEAEDSDYHNNTEVVFVNQNVRPCRRNEVWWTYRRESISKVCWRVDIRVLLNKYCSAVEPIALLFQSGVIL